MLGDYVLGPVTRAAESEFAAELARARRAHDLRGAVRAAGPASDRDANGNRALLERLAKLARGGPVRAGHIRQAEEEVDEADPPIARTRAGIGFALTRLVAGQTEAIAFVEIGRDAIAVQALVAGAMGVPVQQLGDRMAWTDIMPKLPPDRDLRYLRMAGGIGLTRPEGALGDGTGLDLDQPDDDTLGSAALIALIDDAVQPVLTRMRAVADAAVAASQAGRSASSLPRWPARTDVVLVRRLYQWPVLNAAIASATALLRPVASVVVAAGAGDLAEVVEDLAAQAPLRYAYDLVIAEVGKDDGRRGGRDAAVAVTSRELFAAGSAALPGRETVTVPLAAPPSYAADTLALPIVVRHGPVVDLRDPDAVKEGRPLIEMVAMAGDTTGPVDLQVTLLRPGQVEVADADWQRSPARAPAWPALVGTVPERLPSADPWGNGLDLVLLVELGGQAETVAARVDLARGVVDAFLGAPDTVRIAVLGYRDHFARHNVDAIDDPRQEHAALVVGRGLRTPAAARKVLAPSGRWQPVRIQDYHAAPLEDALQLIAGMDDDWGWAYGARHVLLVIGGRPPHPPRTGPEGGEMLPCPHRRSWEESLGRLRTRRAVQCFAVLDRRATRGYADHAWRQLSEQGRYPAGSVTPDQLARAVGLAPPTPAAELCLATSAAVQG
jgi:hypothetical protein